MRERFFTPRLRFKTYEELNAWLQDKCVTYAKAHCHVEQPERTIWNVFEEERGKLVEYRGPFDGFHTVPASVSKTCTVRFDTNKYAGGFQAHNNGIKIRNGKCQMSQTRRLWMGRPHRRCREGEQFQLDGPDPQIRLP
ncbi:hypothetical protein ABID26_004133 [Mesorhizobium shonense]|uniref:Transposase n=1 Tax=Mesorhizobium shonense TaxID=1209948 RepID=A0ABV2HVS8_9HYPH